MQHSCQGRPKQAPPQTRGHWPKRGLKGVPRVGPPSQKMARKHRIQVVLEVLGPIRVDLDHFRDFDFSTFRTGLSQHFFSKIGPGKPESGTRKTRLGTWKIGPRQMEYDPRQMEYDPRQMEYGPRQMEYGPRQMEYGPRQMEYGPRQMHAQGQL